MREQVGGKLNSKVATPGFFSAVDADSEFHQRDAKLLPAAVSIIPAGFAIPEGKVSPSISSLYFYATTPRLAKQKNRKHKKIQCSFITNKKIKLLTSINQRSFTDHACLFHSQTNATILKAQLCGR